MTVSPHETPHDPLGEAFFDLNRAADALKKAHVPDEHLVDAIGDLDVIRRQLDDTRKSWLVEAPRHQPGDRWVITQGRQAKRSYNPMRIINDYADTRGLATLGAVLDLVDRGALRFTWLWSKLEPALQAAGVDLEISSSQLPDHPDLDEPHVGAVWGDASPKIEAVEPKEGEAF